MHVASFLPVPAAFTFSVAFASSPCPCLNGKRWASESRLVVFVAVALAGPSAFTFAVEVAVARALGGSCLPCPVPFAFAFAVAFSRPPSPALCASQDAQRWSSEPLSCVCGAPVREAKRKARRATDSLGLIGH